MPSSASIRKRSDSPAPVFRARPRTSGKSSVAEARCGGQSRASISSSSFGRANQIPELPEDQRFAFLESKSRHIPDDAAVCDEHGDSAGGSRSAKPDGATDE